jgi:hypothetical protein
VHKACLERNVSGFLVVLKEQRRRSQSNMSAVLSLASQLHAFP